MKLSPLYGYFQMDVGATIETPLLYMLSMEKSPQSVKFSLLEAIPISRQIGCLA